MSDRDSYSDCGYSRIGRYSQPQAPISGSQYNWTGESFFCLRRTIRNLDVAATTAFSQAGYCFRSNGGPLILLTLSPTVTSTRLAIFTKGMPFSFRSLSCQRPLSL